MPRQDWTKLTPEKVREELYRMYNEAVEWQGTPGANTQGDGTIQQVLEFARNKKQQQGDMNAGA